MSFETVLPIWNAIQGRFHKTVQKLPEADLTLELGSASIGYMLRHNAEVEYMFANWFLGVKIPEGIKLYTAGGPNGPKVKPAFTNLQELVDDLTASNDFLIEAMRNLPEEAWSVPVESPMGPSTPLEAVGRLMYHTGIHSGQISLIQKHFAVKENAAEAPAQH
ncbi:DinB family protein [Paenibacillus sp. LMG 31461]|uniref:DinB family protein n=1 Tax=Paenibacillus plantarum TaxID=2654975 RepID=A0ABX1XM03_9BACL|nr:DinB family protein [Paenibacillus plantarum]NOU69580.1 DinB family protein [Paenibacillus plantarum]